MQFLMNSPKLKWLGLLALMVAFALAVANAAPEPSKEVHQAPTPSGVASIEYQKTIGGCFEYRGILYSKLGLKEVKGDLITLTTDRGLLTLQKSEVPLTIQNRFMDVFVSPKEQALWRTLQTQTIVGKVICADEFGILVDCDYMGDPNAVPGPLVLTGGKLRQVPSHIAPMKGSGTCLVTDHPQQSQVAVNSQISVLTVDTGDHYEYTAENNRVYHVPVVSMQLSKSRTIKDLKKLLGTQPAIIK